MHNNSVCVCLCGCMGVLIAVRLAGCLPARLCLFARLLFLPAPCVPVPVIILYYIMIIVILYNNNNILYDNNIVVVIIILIY